MYLKLRLIHPSTLRAC